MKTNPQNTGNLALDQLLQYQQNNRYQTWTEDFVDEDTGQVEQVERSLLIDSEYDEEEARLLDIVYKHIQDISTERLLELRQLMFFGLDDMPLLRELAHRGEDQSIETLRHRELLNTYEKASEDMDIPTLVELHKQGLEEASIFLGNTYYFGDKEKGIISDLKLAKEYFPAEYFDHYFDVDPNLPEDVVRCMDGRLIPITSNLFEDTPLSGIKLEYITPKKIVDLIAHYVHNRQPEEYYDIQVRFFSRSPKTYANIFGTQLDEGSWYLYIDINGVDDFGDALKEALKKEVPSEDWKAECWYGSIVCYNQDMI